MGFVILGVILLLAAIFVPFGKFLPGRTIGMAARFGVSVLAVVFFAMTSVINVGGNEVGHLEKIYGAKSLIGGAIIATDGEKGFQSVLIAPGFHFIPFVTVINHTKTLPIVEIPAGFYGRLEARDGLPLPEGAIMAQAWDDSEFQNMLDAKYFLTNGGEKGLQASVLKPGKYRINLFLFNVVVANGQGSGFVYNEQGRRKLNENSKINTLQTVISAGRVGVVTSKISRRGLSCIARNAVVEGAEVLDDALSVPLVPVGCRGIWQDALLPGGYFLNHDAFDITIVDTRVQTWQYRGGYTKRIVDLTVDQEGNITQEERKIEVRYDPKTDAGEAINVKVEGWDIPQEVRAVVQISPENAPIVVAAVGGLDQVRDRVLTPKIRSIVRNVVGSSVNIRNDDGTVTRRPTRVMDLIEHRSDLEFEIAALVRKEGLRAGVNITEVRFGEPSIPPELLLARQRQQLSQQLSLAFREERKAQVERIETEQARATANQQKQLVKAQIAVKVAEQKEIERATLGRAEQAFLTSVAEGQKAQALVLGEDRVVTLRIVDMILEALQNNPEILTGIQLPQTFVTGGGSSLAGMAAILKGGGGTLFGGKSDNASK